MNQLISTAIVSCVLLSTGALRAEPSILGEYVEARTCDVWTGPCFANGEINLRGDNAVLAWTVRKGAWDGVELRDKTVVLVLDAEGTLTTDAEGKVRTVVYLDDGATETEGKALISLAATLAPRYTKNIVKIERRKISYARDDLKVELKVGETAEVKILTAGLSKHCDSVCGNESSFYPALSKLTHVDCAKTVENHFGGTALGLTWSDPNKRSAILGQFAL